MQEILMLYKYFWHILLSRFIEMFFAEIPPIVLCDDPGACPANSRCIQNQRDVTCVCFSGFTGSNCQRKSFIVQTLLFLYTVVMIDKYFASQWCHVSLLLNFSLQQLLRNTFIPN